MLNRCEELGITERYQGISDKVGKLKEVTTNFSMVAYIGDDENDMPCMKMVKEAGGLIGCPADATNKVKEIADYISKKNGGEGAVREFIEFVVKYESNL